MTNLLSQFDKEPNWKKCKVCKNDVIERHVDKNGVCSMCNGSITVDEIPNAPEPVTATKKRQIKEKYRADIDG